MNIFKNQHLTTGDKDGKTVCKLWSTDNITKVEEKAQESIQGKCVRETALGHHLKLDAGGGEKKSLAYFITAYYEQYLERGRQRYYIIPIYNGNAQKKGVPWWLSW